MSIQISVTLHRGVSRAAFDITGIEKKENYTGSIFELLAPANSFFHYQLELFSHIKKYIFRKI